MTRLEALKLQDKLFGQCSTIIEICMGLRMSLNGSADWWGQQLTDQTLEIVKARLDSWTPNLNKVDRKAEKYLRALYEDCARMNWENTGKTL